MATSRSRDRARTPSHPLQKPRPTAPRRVPVAGLIVGAIVLLAAVAIGVTALSGGEAPAEAAVEVADTVTVDGAPLPQLPGGGTDPALATAAPTLQGVDPDGEPLSYAPGGGRATLAVVGAHWCPHCQAELPRIVEWMDEGGAEGVDVVGVSTAADDSAPNWPPSAWWEREGFDAPVLVDSADDTAAAALGVSGFPFLVLTDADGLVVGRWAGEVGTDVLDEAIAGL